MPIISGSEVVRFDVEQMHYAVRRVEALGAFRDTFGSTACRAALQILDERVLLVPLLDTEGSDSGLEMLLTDLTGTKDNGAVAGIVYLGRYEEDQDALQRLLKIPQRPRVEVNQNLLAALFMLPEHPDAEKSRSSGHGLAHLAVIGSSHQDGLNLFDVRTQDLRVLPGGHRTASPSGGGSEQAGEPLAVRRGFKSFSAD